MGLRPLACWDFRFESRRGQHCVSLVSVVCCQIEVSCVGPITRPEDRTDWGVSECDLESSTRRRPWPTGGCRSVKENVSCVYVAVIIIKSFYSLWSTGHPWRASRHCGLQLCPWPRYMAFLCFLSHPLLSFSTFSSAYLSFYIREDSNLMHFSLLLLFPYEMCPIQFHFLLFIWFSIDLWWLILHSSSFVILSVYFIFIIRLKHLFTNICSLLAIWLVFFQVSQTYNNTDFAFVLNVRILTSFDMLRLRSCDSETRFVCRIHWESRLLGHALLKDREGYLRVVWRLILDALWGTGDICSWLGWCNWYWD